MIFTDYVPDYNIPVVYSPIPAYDGNGLKSIDVNLDGVADYLVEMNKNGNIASATYTYQIQPSPGSYLRSVNDIFHVYQLGNFPKHDFLYHIVARKFL